MLSSARPGEQEKIRIQLQNVKRILKEIYERRERKILDLALNVIRTETSGYIDTKNMLAEEKALFDESLVMLKRYKDGVLFSVFDNKLPSIVPGSHYDDIKPEQEEDGSFGSHPRDTGSVDSSGSGEIALDQVDVGEKEEFPVIESTPSDQIRDDTSSEERGVLVKFLTSVPKFYGKNKEIYGPYADKQIVTLPAMIANILLKKGKVENVMSE